MIRRTVAALLPLLVLCAVAPASASTTTNLKLVAYGHNSFYNYDFDSRTAAATNVDWPVDMIFYGNASVSKVYAKIGWSWSGSNEYMLLNSGSGATWVSAGGRKNTICTDTHYRLYAPAAAGYFTDPVLGHYVIATTHLDKNECGTSPTYGWNETAEQHVAARAAQEWGTRSVKHDATTLPGGTSTLTLLDNFNETGWQGNHYFYNDGLPTLVKVR
ncbi:MAG TPA: hypothetical protein VGQ45_15705 [Gaiellales bacterium]|jgi:hypothetical protein|nr:hypothetical protein [Gaiellales bacterium]